jgi:hypothetical protein
LGLYLFYGGDRHNRRAGSPSRARPGAGQEQQAG